MCCLRCLPVVAANPLEDWPKDIIFFVRVASLLHGLCVQLKVHIPFLQIMVRRAQECLFNRYQPPSPLIYTHFLGGRGAAKWCARHLMDACQPCLLLHMHC